MRFLTIPVPQNRAKPSENEKECPTPAPASCRITEVGEGAAGDDCYEECFDGDSPVNPLVAQVEVHTLGGWMVNLRIMAPAGNLVHHHRHWFAHFMQLPVVAFRLKEGGIGLLNPNNLTRVSAHPQPDGVPEGALPMELLALHAGIAGRADAVLIPEIPYDIAKVAAHIKRRTAGHSHQYSIVVVAEGAKPLGGGVTLKEAANAGHVERLGGVGEIVAADDYGVMTARTLDIAFGD